MEEIYGRIFSSRCSVFGESLSRIFLEAARLVGLSPAKARAIVEDLGIECFDPSSLSEEREEYTDEEKALLFEAAFKVSNDLLGEGGEMAMMRILADALRSLPNALELIKRFFEPIVDLEIEEKPDKLVIRARPKSEIQMSEIPYPAKIIAFTRCGKLKVLSTRREGDRVIIEFALRKFFNIAAPKI